MELFHPPTETVHHLGQSVVKVDLIHEFLPWNSQFDRDLPFWLGSRKLFQWGLAARMVPFIDLLGDKDGGGSISDMGEDNVSKERGSESPIVHLHHMEASVRQPLPSRYQATRRHSARSVLSNES